MNNDKDSALDLDALDMQQGADAGARMDLLHPATGEPTGAWLTLLGTDSDIYRRAQRALQRKRMARAVKSRRMAIPPEELEAEALDLLVAVTTGWGGLNAKGQPLAFSADAARAFYTRHRWAREQAEEFIGERANFLPKSATTS